MVMSEELRKPLVDAVMEFLAEEGAVERRYRAAADEASYISGATVAVTGGKPIL